MIRMALCVTLVLSASGALAQTEVAVDRMPDELKTMLEPSPTAVTTDTAIVFTSLFGSAQLVRCTARDGDGNIIGRSVTRVPAYGVRFVRASDLGNGQAYLGRVRCRSSRQMITSAFIVTAGGITAARVREHQHDGTIYAHVPVTVTN